MMMTRVFSIFRSAKDSSGLNSISSASYTNRKHRASPRVSGGYTDGRSNTTNIPSVKIGDAVIIAATSTVETDLEKLTSIPGLEESMNNPLDFGPFYHGTKADLQIGDVLEPGFSSNYGEQAKANLSISPQHSMQPYGEQSLRLVTSQVASIRWSPLVSSKMIPI